MRIYHGGRLRKGRVSEAGRPYLITTITRDRLPIFHDWRIGRLLVASLRDATVGHYAETLAWVVMPDHLHWLLIPDLEPLDTVVRRVKSCSGRVVNRRIGVTGPLWQRGYHDHALRRDEDIRSVARYIVANPLRTGIVKEIGDYPLWDSIYLL